MSNPDNKTRPVTSLKDEDVSLVRPHATIGLNANLFTAHAKTLPPV